MKNAIGYIRVSTDGQVGEDKFGIEAQREAILRYAEENGYTVVRWEMDEGVSGCDENPPALGRLLYGEDVSHETYRAVIAFKSDRIARDTKLYFYRLYLLERKGVKLLSTQENFVGELENVMRSLMLFVAEQERKNINMRTTNGRRVKSSCGGYSGGRLPYGYRAENHGYAVDEKESGIVRRIFDEYDCGASMRGIAVRLNEDKVLTRSNGSWATAQVKSIIDNRKTYEGYYHYGGNDWVLGMHEAIL